MTKTEKDSKNALPLTGRFAASGGVARPKGSEENQPLCLVASVVNPPPAASRWDVSCKRAEVRLT
jgi:hypothetical protein